MQPIIIIGAGLAGYTVARELRKLDASVPLTIITADDGGFYSKPMLSNALALNKSASELVTQSAARMAASLDAHILARTRVTAIDGVNKTLSTSGGPLRYEKLVIAAGAQPIRLAIGGDAAGQVLSVNHVDDYAIFRDRLALIRNGEPARLTILGAGLIGCEFADDLASAGHRVAIVDPNSAPLAALAAPALSHGLQTAFLARGIKLHLATTAISIDRAPGGMRVALASGALFETDIVLSAVGLRPDLSLARIAGLDSGRGIMVDRTGQTSMRDIYALGDCAEYRLEGGRSGILPYIAPLMTAARAIARTLSGDITPIDLKAAAIIVKTPSYPMALLAPPVDMAATGLWRVATENARTVCRFYDEQGVVRGFGVTPQTAAIRQSLLDEVGRATESPLPAGSAA